MKKYFYSVITLFSVCAATAQDKNVVHVDIVSDQPENLKIFKVHLPLWELQASKHNLSIYDLNAGGLMLMNDFALHAEYSFSLGDRLWPDSYEGNITGNDLTQMIMFPVNASTRANSFLFEGTYFFKKKTVTKDIRITLSRRSNGNVTYEKYTMVPGTELQRFGLRLGYKKGVSWYAMNGNNVKCTAGSVTTEYNYGIQSTNMVYSHVHAGISFSRTRNLKVMTTEFGPKSNSGAEFFYADLIFAPTLEFDDVYSAVYYDGSSGPNGNTMYYEQFKITSEKSKIGFRLGYESIPFRGLLGLRAEIGINPGLKGMSNIFVQFGARFYFGTKG
ncbi:MAG TPA: hypothetical protein VK177_12410 [Flavobacteriales bacterium]|nr:hypothetical protein [Flavobacteriales bacterium]